MSPAVALRRLLERLQAERTSVMALARQGQPPEPWRLYPGEYGVFDRRTRCQFYYHAHAEADHEAGHFHTVRLFADHTVHLVAISMAETGWPQALFTLNLWAVGDAYAPPAEVKRYARRFRLDPTVGDHRLVGFLNLMFVVFRAEIEALQDAKEQALQAHRTAHPGQEIFEDRSIEVLSRVQVDLRGPAPA